MSNFKLGLNPELNSLKYNREKYAAMLSEAAKRIDYRVMGQFYSEQGMFPNLHNDISLAFSQKDGVRSLYVNGILMSPIIERMVVNDKGHVDVGLISSILAGKTHLISPVVQRIIDGNNYPNPPMPRSYMFGAVSYARRIARFKPIVGWEFGRRNFPVRSALGEVQWYRIADDVIANYPRNGKVQNSSVFGAYGPVRFIL